MNANRRAIAAILDRLGNEFELDDPAETDAKIRSKLNRRWLPYRFDQQTIDELRALKNDLAREVDKYERSDYYRGPLGHLASENDFDLDRLARDMAVAHPGVPTRELRRFVRWMVIQGYVM